MANITIDPDLLIKAMAAAIQAAVVQQTQPVKQAEGEPSVEVKRKRGRPPKTKKAESSPSNKTDSVNVEILVVEDEIIHDSEPKKPRAPRANTSYITSAKANRVSSTGLGEQARSEPVTKRRGQMKFIDVENVPHAKAEELAWTPSERRPAAEMLNLQCDKCNGSFQGYASEYPQALMKEKDPASGTIDSPRIYCDNCILGVKR